MAFFINLFSYDLALAANGRSSNSFADSSLRGAIATKPACQKDDPSQSSRRANHKELNVSTFSLPEYLGHVKDTWQVSENPMFQGAGFRVQGTEKNAGHSDASLSRRHPEAKPKNLEQVDPSASPQDDNFTVVRPPNTQYPIRNTKPIVIHIQDAHCNYYAQHKISEIIEYLNREYGIDTVNLEGGAKGYDLSIFTDIKDKDIRKKVSDYFVKEGLVNGAEYFAINNTDKNITLWGVEDTKLYIDNLNVYRKSLKHKDEVDKALDTLTHALNELKTKIYSPELLELDTKYSQYKAGTLEFKDYLTYLTRLDKSNPPVSNLVRISSVQGTVFRARVGARSPRPNVKGAGTAPLQMDPVIPAQAGIHQFHNIHLLNQTLEMEKGIDFREAERDRDDLIDRMHKRLSLNAKDGLAAKTVEFSAGRTSRKDYYGYLVDTALRFSVDVDGLSELSKYIIYVTIYDTIDKTVLMNEVDGLEEKVKGALFENDAQRDLARLSKNLAILKNIFNLTLTKEDYKYYLDNKDSFNISNHACLNYD